jgi:SAM-dependent methyltransferase
MGAISMTISLIYRPLEAALVEFFSDSAAVLDIGCGPGQYREVLGDSYIGMDITTEAYKDEINRGTDIVGDARWIPLATDSLDAAFSVAVIYQVPDFAQAISEVLRVLKPGGRFLLFDYNWRTLRRLAKLEFEGTAENRKFRTQMGWKRELESQGFVDTKIWLEPEFEGRHYNKIERLIRLFRNELRTGGWACISGMKPAGK